MKFDEWLGVVGIVVSVAAWLIDRKQVLNFCRKWIGLILALFAAVILFWLWQRGCFSWLFHPVKWPVWALILLGVAGLMIVLAIAFVVSWPGASLHKPDQTQYRNDEIEGVLWAWNWYYDKIDDSSLTAFCPDAKCKTRLTFQFNDRSRDYRSSQIPCSLYCRKCGFRADFEISEQNIKKNVLYEIESRVNTGAWLNRLNRKSPSD